MFSLFLGILLNVLSAEADVNRLIEYGNQTKSGSFILDYLPAYESYGLRSFSPEGLQEVLLTEDGYAENSYFRIVEGQNYDALPLEDLEARNVLFHLMKARQYFQSLELENEAIDRKVIVRVRVKEAYNLVSHFGERPSFNNARYIPANYAGKWAQEIWFHEQKRKVGWFTLIFSLAAPFVTQEPLSIIAIPSQVKRSINEGLKSSMVPSVIYHEAFHWASDSQNLIPVRPHWVPLAEDLANYFSICILGSPQVAAMAEYADELFAMDFSKIRKAKVEKKSLEHYNYPVFLPALLWKIRTDLLDPITSDSLVWQTMNNLNGDYSYRRFYEKYFERISEASIDSTRRATVLAYVRFYRGEFERLDVLSGEHF